MHHVITATVAAGTAINVMGGNAGARMDGVTLG